MSKLPLISARKCIKALHKAGFYFVRQKGSNVYLRRDEPFAQVSVPNHRELHNGTLKGILNDAGLTVDEFIGLL